MWTLNLPYRIVSGYFYLVKEHYGNHGSESNINEVVYHIHEPFLPDNAPGKRNT